MARQIDFTLPCETDETPPRPVMVLYALGNDTPYGFVVYNITKTATDEFWLMTDENRPNIRNVVNVAPKPVRMEGWLNLYSDAGITPSLIGNKKDAAFIAAGHGDKYVETRHIVWNSDGSPVEATTVEDDTGCGLLRHVDDFGREDGHTLTMVSGGGDYIGDFETGFPRSIELRRMHDRSKTMTYVAAADRDHWKTKAEETLALLQSRNDAYEALLSKAEALQAEVATAQEVARTYNRKLGEFMRKTREAHEKIIAMRPVVDAAMAWDEKMRDCIKSRYDDHLVKAVRAYQNAHPATSESHEEVVRDALSTEWARMAEPVKNCTTCKWVHHRGLPCSNCFAPSHTKWEPKS